MAARRKKKSEKPTEEKPPAKMLKYLCTFECELQVHPDVIKQVDVEWRKTFYDLIGEEKIVEHLAYNAARGIPLTSLEGWADLKDEQLKVVGFTCVYSEKIEAKDE